MNEKEKTQLAELLKKLTACKCPIAKGVTSTCFTNCPFYINGAYGGECAISTVEDNIT